MRHFEATAEFARKLDQSDPLAVFRKQFHIPKRDDGSDCLYLCGNSLGLQPKNVREYIDQELEDWARLAVAGHFKAKRPWLPYHEFLTESAAKLVGARPSEVVIMNSLTVNLHLMLVSFYRPLADRYKIAVESNAFPSDLYAVKSHLQFHGYDPREALLEVPPRDGEMTLRTEDIEAFLAAHGQEIALVLFSGVNYYSGQAFDMARITRAAHARGCVVGFDLAHAAGNLAPRLHEWGVDFAVWCSYKYLNAGPGAVAGCFVHENHARRFDLPRFAGWWGHDKATRFQMGPDFVPIEGAEGWQVSNPPILQMAALRASLDIFDAAGIERLRGKSVHLTGYLEFLLRRFNDPRLEIITPSQPEERGAQLSIRIAGDGKAIFEALLARGVICDWRNPGVIRVAPVPLYNTFSDVFRFSQLLGEILAGN